MKSKAQKDRLSFRNIIVASGPLQRCHARRKRRQRQLLPDLDTDCRLGLLDIPFKAHCSHLLLLRPAMATGYSNPDLFYSIHSYANVS